MGDRGEEVPRVGQAVAADGAEVRQAQRGAVVLADIATGAGVQQLDTELHAARDHGDFQGLHIQQAQFGGDAQAALLGNDQQFAVGIEEHPLHRGVGAVQVHADARGLFGIAGGGDGQQAVDEVGAFGGDVLRVPAQAVGRHRTQAIAGDLALQALVLRMVGRRLDAVHPGPPGLAARHGEGGSGKQLGVQAVGHFLRGVLADGQGTGQRLAAEFVVETGLIGERSRGDHVDLAVFVI
ncbi:hypothetical protein D9M71_57290 [compost metagenome]